MTLLLFTKELLLNMSSKLFKIYIQDIKCPFCDKGTMSSEEYTMNYDGLVEDYSCTFCHRVLSSTILSDSSGKYFYNDFPIWEISDLKYKKNIPKPQERR